MSDLWDYGDDCASQDSLKAPACPQKMCLSLLSDDESPPRKKASYGSSDGSSGSYTPVARSKRKAEDEVSARASKSQRSETRVRQQEKVNEVIEVARKQQIELAAVMDDFSRNIKEAEQLTEDDDGEDWEDQKEDVKESNPAPDDDGKTTKTTKQSEDSGVKIVLVCQDRARRSAKVRMGLEEEFESLFSRYKKHAVSKGWVEENDKLQFRFDDDVVSATDTPQSLDCEDQDMIDVFVL